MNIALSDKDIKRALGNNTLILSYFDLAKYKSVEDILRAHHSAIILYINQGDNRGHWTCIIKHPDRSGSKIDRSGSKIDRLEFFDSYGGIMNGRPDAEFQFIDKDQRKINYRGAPYLSKLLYDYAKKGGVVEYNHHELQKEGQNIATCGRHCIARIKTRHLPLDTYASMIKRLGDIDKTVVDLTRGLIGK